MSIIADVLERYGRYSAALEREFIASQQRTAPRLAATVSQADREYTRRDMRDARGPVALLLRRHPREWTVAEVKAALQISEGKVYRALEYWRARGDVRVGKHRSAGNRKLYRWQG